jgi:hypothetical protein
MTGDYALETWTIHAGVDPTDTTGALVPRPAA